MNVLSLFDGMSCGQIALKRVGISFETYYASEVDKHAITVTQANHSETIQLGDVTCWREWDVDWSSIGLIMGGSPCQGFSFAGKGLAFDDPRSRLFFVFVEIVNHVKSVNPNVKFLLENVRMKKEYLDLISDYMSVEPVFINSALVSAQNRQRFYWANWNFSAPVDRGLVLADIVEDDGVVDRDKSYAVDANYWKGGDLNQYFNKSRRQIVLTKAKRDLFGYPMDEAFVKNPSGLVLVGEAADIKGHGYNKRVYHSKGKSPSLCAASGGNLEPKVTHPATVVGRRLQNGVRKDDDKNIPINQCLEVRDNIKMPCLTTVGNDSVISELPKGRYPDAYTDEMKLYYRKLTPIECERLQTVPDNYTNHVSNTQRYRMLGNGWTVDVIAHILSSRGENDLLESRWQ